MIDNRVIAAKELYAAQMGFENQMRYEMVKASATYNLLKPQKSYCILASKILY